MGILLFIIYPKPYSIHLRETIGFQGLGLGVRDVGLRVNGTKANNGQDSVGNVQAQLQEHSCQLFGTTGAWAEGFRV